MKTQEQNLNSEMHQFNSDDGSPRIPLDKDEKLIYSEKIKQSDGSPLSVALGIFLTLGFPVYVVIGFTAITSYIVDKTFTEFWSEMTWPLVILGIILVFSMIAALALKLFWLKLCPAGSSFVITDKRLFDFMPGGIMPIANECLYGDLNFICPESVKTYDSLKAWRLKYDSESGKMLESITHYRVNNAKLAYLQLPNHIISEKGEKSLASKKYTANARLEKAIGIFVASTFVGFVAFGSILFYAQTFVENGLKDGKRAYAHKHYVEAEKIFARTYSKIAKFPFHTFFGPVSYRYALALHANGKLDEAVPRFKDAIVRCDWSNSDENLTWRPAVFRSNIHLAEIYRHKGDLAQAEAYFDSALNTVPKETDRKRVDAFFLEFENFLREKHDDRKAATVQKVAQNFEFVRTHEHAFRE